MLLLIVVCLCDADCDVSTAITASLHDKVD